MTQVFPYLWVGLLLFGLWQTVRRLVQALRAGVVDEGGWHETQNADDHYGFALRIGGFIVLIGATLLMLSKTPEIFALIGTE